MSAAPAAGAMARTRRDRLAILLTHAVLAVWAAVMVFPFLWMLATSLKPAPEILAFPPHLLPRAPTALNYARAFQTAPFARFFLNSVVVAALSTAVIVATSTAAGYVFGKFRFPGATAIFMLFLATAILPLETYMVPLYLTMRNWHWINTYPGLVAPYLVMSFGVFIMRQYFSTALPDELLDAARIDGASEWRIFARIAVPASTSAMAAVAIFAAIQAWTGFIWPLIIASSQDMYTMEVGLAFFQQRYTVDYGAITAGATVSAVPIIAVFLFFRRHITEGIAFTGFR
jgi:multiple sugar transport system permease protein